MGVKDQALQDYLKDNRRYADLFNGGIFNGKQIMDPAYLCDVQRKKRIPRITVPAQENNPPEDSVPWIMYLERERDFLRKNEKPGERFEAAVEAQTDADYTMPARLFGNDGIEFYDQMSGEDLDNSRNADSKNQDCENQDSRTEDAAAVQDENQGKRQPKRPLFPIFHLVLYLGEKRWKSKLRLREMMEIPEKLKEFAEFLPEYHVKLADIHEQDPELFHTEWKDIFRLMRHSRKKEDLKKYIEEHKEEISSLSRDTRLLLAVLLDQYKILDENRVEVPEVCTAWDGAMEMYKTEGKEEGQEQISLLGLRMKAENRIDDFFRSLSDMNYRKKLLREYGISAESTI